MQRARLVSAIILALVLPALLVLYPYYFLQDYVYPNWMESPVKEVLWFVLAVLPPCLRTDRWTILVGMLATVSFVLSLTAVMEHGHISPLGSGLMLFCYGPVLVLLSIAISGPVVLYRDFQSKLRTKDNDSAKST